MTAKNPYEILGVAKNADADAIKKAYRALARKHHPDANPDDASAEDRFKDVQDAYDLLSDPEKRRQYDEFGAFGGQGGPGGFGNMRFENVDLGDLSDLFGRFGGFFGGGGAAQRGGGRPRPQKGVDLESRVRISFDDALEGIQVRVPVELDTACHVCAGTGSEPGTAPRTCPDCNGTGITADSHGLFSLSQPCRRCRGNGVIVEKPCKTCRGSGRERVTKRYLVKIPAGAKDGTRIRVKGKGELGANGGPPGDLWVRVEVEQSKLYERRGADLVLDLPLTYPEAALGAEIEIPTPDGNVKLRVPAGTDHGKLLRVRGRGAPKLSGGGRGDLLARVKVTIPSKLTKAEKDALEDYQKASRERPREGVFGA
ncbi:MAG: molecular chaperone DnaJ [Gaiella sp.]